MVKFFINGKERVKIIILTLSYFMGLTKDQLNDVCLIYGGHMQCKYLDEAKNDKGEVVHVCRKLTAERLAIDIELEDILEDFDRKGLKHDSQGIPLGNNCSGYQALPNVEQGYDLD